MDKFRIKNNVRIRLANRKIIYRVPKSVSLGGDDYLIAKVDGMNWILSLESKSSETYVLNRKLESNES
jgi:hypothetical protein